jgi:HicB family
MTHKCKRIIDGKTYNTETATQIAGWDDDDYNSPFSSGDYLYQNRFGAFFQFKYLDTGDEDGYETIVPFTPEQAREWLEKKVSWKPELIEAHFGQMPEAGTGEIKYTLRLPESLRNKLAARAEENKQSLNAWMVRCLERCAEAVK